MWFKIETTKDDLNNVQHRKIAVRCNVLLLLFQTIAFLHFLLTLTESNLETRRIYIMARTFFIFISLAIYTGFISFFIRRDCCEEPRKEVLVRMCCWYLAGL